MTFSSRYYLTRGTKPSRGEFKPSPKRVLPPMTSPRVAGPLGRFNDAQEERFLHPTKGWRRVSIKRSRAAHIVAKIKAGVRPFPQLPYVGWTTQVMAVLLEEGV